MGTPDLERFNRWAATYDRHLLQPLLFLPVQQAALDFALEEVPQPQRILDVGCGTGRLLRACEGLSTDTTLIGVDAAWAMIQEGRKRLSPGSRIRLLQAVAEALPFPQSSFDVIFSTLSFHHWQPEPGLKEIERVLTGHGRFFLAEFLPRGPGRMVRVFRARPLDESWLRRSLTKSGLYVVAERRPRRFLGQLAILAVGKLVEKAKKGQTAARGL
jgi:ubiquinone/menaquinone biosynthesis C-methylase UbiE